MPSINDYLTPLSAPEAERLRRRVRETYRKVATAPEGPFHFLTGRAAAARVGYSDCLLERVPDPVVDAFAGVASPFHWGLPGGGETVVDVGSGSGLDSFIAARAVGDAGQVVGVDMTGEMLERAQAAADRQRLRHLEFRDGDAGSLPVPDGWADLVISNGVLNLVPDKPAAYEEIRRVLRPGGRLQIADILVARPVPEGARRDIDLWTG